MRCLAPCRFVVLAGLLVSSASGADELPSQFTLGRYVPDDVWMFINGARNHERDWLCDEWTNVFDAVSSSGIDRDILSLVVSLIPEKDRARAEGTLDNANELFRAVRWRDLISQELVAAERLTTTKSNVYDYFLLARGKAGTGESNFRGLVAILSEVSSWCEAPSVTRYAQDGTDVWTLAAKCDVLTAFGGRISLLRRGDLIGLVNGSKGLEEVLDLMSEHPRGSSILASPRFREAVAQVKPPEDMVMFFDVKMLLRNLNGLIEPALAKKAGDDSKKTAWLAAVTKGMTLFDVIDYSVTTVETEGRRELAHSVLRIQRCREKNCLACCCLARKPFKRFDKYIPAEATAFSLSGSIDIGALYDIVTGFIRESVPGGADGLTAWNATLASVGFDPRRDLFSWWSGEMIYVTMPPAVVTPLGGADSVHMIRVKNAELASRKVNAFIDFAQRKIQAMGQMLLVSPADVQVEGFRTITHPVAMMFLRPVIGVTDDWLVVGTSASAVNRCLTVAAGKASSIRENKRFRDEGLLPKGAVFAASFKDTSTRGQEWGAAAAAVGMFGGMATAGIPDDAPGGKKKKRLIQDVLGIVLKIGPILQKIDFYSSESSVTTYDQASTLRTETVTTYKTSKRSPKTAVAPRAR